MANKRYCASVLRDTARRRLLWALGSLAGAAAFYFLAGDLDFRPGYTTRAEGQSYAAMIALALCLLVVGVVCLILALFTFLRPEQHPFTQGLRRRCPDQADTPVRALFALVDGDLNEYGETFGGGAAVMGRQWLFFAPPLSFALRLRDICGAAWQGDDKLLLALAGGGYATLTDGRLTRPVLMELLILLQARQPSLILWSSILELDQWRQQQRGLRR